ncbi:MAG: RNA polymerase sigma factor (sigma-70 family) [Kiritimatiellia bacterium]|jgi:RNA polymerase sigma factor (sigma-70 family)
MSRTLTQEDQIARQNKLKQLMDKVALDRDKNAFSLLFDHFAPLLRSFSLAREPGAALMADDLAQVVMIKVWEKAHTYNSEKASLSTWVYTLARNSRIDMLRRNGRYTTDIDPEYLWQDIVDESTDPFLDVQQKRIEKDIAHAFKQLPIDQSLVLTKVFMQGKTHQESAHELGLALGTVKSRIRLALKKMKILVRQPSC